MARTTEMEALYSLSVDLFSAAGRAGAIGDATARALEMAGATAGGLILFEGDGSRVAYWRGETYVPSDAVLRARLLSRHSSRRP